MNRLWRILIGADDGAFEYKEILKEDLNHCDRVAEVVDVGVDVATRTPYPHIAIDAGRRIAAGEADRALLVGSTGIGMAIAANKVSGVRAATAHDSYSLRQGVLSADAQVLCLGQQVIGLALARALVAEWLTYEFDCQSVFTLDLQLIGDYEAGTLAYGARV